MSSTPLIGHVAVVTGASRGIGKVIAVHLARQGAAVAGIARASPYLLSLPQEANGAAGRLLAVAADVTSAAEVEAAFARIDDVLGIPGQVIACAGTADALGPLWLADPQQWWQAVTVDLRATMLTAHCAVRRMLATGPRSAGYDLRQSRRPAARACLGTPRRQGRYRTANRVTGRHRDSRARRAPGFRPHADDRTTGSWSSGPGVAAGLRRNVRPAMGRRPARRRAHERYRTRRG
jgi:NAD(P)-dependent dehydrogenase (short-subunit alcohol dehydrogenase family)